MYNPGIEESHRTNLLHIHALKFCLYRLPLFHGAEYHSLCWRAISKPLTRYHTPGLKVTKLLGLINIRQRSVSEASWWSSNQAENKVNRKFSNRPIDLWCHNEKGIHCHVIFSVAGVIAASRSELYVLKSVVAELTKLCRPGGLSSVHVLPRWLHSSAFTSTTETLTEVGRSSEQDVMTYASMCVISSNPSGP